MRRARLLIETGCLFAILSVSVAAAPGGRGEEPARREVRPQQPTHRLGGPDMWAANGVNGFDFSPDGKYLGVTDGGLTVYNLADRRVFQRVPEVREPWAFLPGGRTVLCLNERRKTIDEFDLDTRKAQSYSADVDFDLLAIRVSGNTAYLFHHGRLLVWDSKEHKQTANYQLTTWKSGAWFTLSPESGRIATFYRTPEQVLSAHVADMRAGKSVGEWAILPENKETEQLGSMVLSPDGKTAYHGGPNGVRGYAPDTGKVQREFATEWCAAVAVSPDGKTLAGLGADGIRLWNTVTGKIDRTLVQPYPHVQTIRFSPDGKTLVAADRAARVIDVWDVGTGKLAYAANAGPRMPVEAVAFTPDSKGLISWGFGERMVWDLANPEEGRRIVPLEIRVPKYAPFPASIYGLPGAWREEGHIAVDPAGKWVAEPHGIWELRTGAVLVRFPGNAHGNQPVGGTVAVSPDGQFVAIPAGRDGVHIWSVADKRLVRELKPRPDEGKTARQFFGRAAFTPDGRTLLALAGELVRAWDLTTGEPIRRVVASGPGGNTLALTPDGHWLVLTGACDRAPGDRHTVQVIERATGQKVRGWSPRPGETAAAAVSPCGRFVATCGHADRDIAANRNAGLTDEWIDDRVVRVWNLLTGEPVAAFPGHQGRVNCVAWAPDGKRLASGSDDATVLVWDTAALPFKLPDRPKPVPADRWWEFLGGSAGTAAELTLDLLANPTDAVPVLRKNLLATPNADKQTVAKLIADIADGDYQTRTAAARGLGEYDIEAVAGAVRAAVGSGGVEARAEFGRLLGDGPGVHVQHARRLRAVRALELIGSKDARAVLDDLAARADAPNLAREAKAALARLANTR